MFQLGGFDLDRVQLLVEMGKTAPALDQRDPDDRVPTEPSEIREQLEALRKRRQDLLGKYPMPAEFIEELADE